MDFWDLVKLMWRRWYVTAPMLLVTAFGAMWVATTVGPEYQVTGHVAVVPPEVQRTVEAGQVARVNPWNEEALAHAASIRLEAKQLSDQLAAAGFAGEWSVEVTGTLPVITVEVVAPTADQAITTMRRLQAVVEDEVAERQATYNIPAQEQIMTVRYDQGESVDTTASRLRRVLVAVVGAGLILTTGVTVAFDAIARWRRSKSRDGQSTAPVEEPPRRRYEYAGTSPAVPGPSRNGAAASPAPGSDFPVFPTPVKVGAEPVPADLAPASSSGGDTSRSTPDDSTVVLPLSNIPWAGRPNGDRATTPGDSDRSAEADQP